MRATLKQGTFDKFCMQHNTVKISRGLAARGFKLINSSNAAELVATPRLGKRCWEVRCIAEISECWLNSAKHVWPLVAIAFERYMMGFTRCWRSPN